MSAEPRHVHVELLDGRVAGQSLGIVQTQHAHVGFVDYVGGRSDVDEVGAWLQAQGIEIPTIIPPKSNT